MRNHKRKKVFKLENVMLRRKKIHGLGFKKISSNATLKKTWLWMNTYQIIENVGEADD